MLLELPAAQTAAQPHMASSSSKSGRKPAAADDPWQQAAQAAAKLSSLWKSSQHASLLRQPPPDAAAAAAASSGPAVKAMQDSLLLLHQLNAAMAAVHKLPAGGALQVQMEQLLQGLLLQHRLPHLLAQLLKWLQQQPQCLLGGNDSRSALSGAATSAAGGQQPGSTAMLWQACMACLAAIAAMVCALSSLTRYLVVIGPGSGFKTAADSANRLAQALAHEGELGHLASLTSPEASQLLKQPFGQLRAECDGTTSATLHVHWLFQPLARPAINL